MTNYATRTTSTSTFHRPGRRATATTTTTTTNSTCAGQFIVEAGRRVNIEISNEILEGLRQEAVTDVWQLEYLDSWQWESLGVPMGLVTSVRRCLDEREKEAQQQQQQQQQQRLSRQTRGRPPLKGKNSSGSSNFKSKKLQRMSSEEQIISDSALLHSPITHVPRVAGGNMMSFVSAISIDDDSKRSLDYIHQDDNNNEDEEYTVPLKMDISSDNDHWTASEECKSGGSGENKVSPPILPRRLNSVETALPVLSGETAEDEEEEEEEEPLPLLKPKRVISGANHALYNLGDYSDDDDDDD